MDTTSSMQSYIEKSITTIKQIIDDVKSINSDIERSLRFGFVAYRDHPP
jgi:hypothetical protein